MAGLSSPGVGSGLDINGLVTKLMDVERTPLNNLDKKEATYQAKISAYGTLKGALSSFQSAVRSLSSSAKFNTVKATPADTSIISANTTSVAKPATYQLEVSSLAQAQKLSMADQDVVADPTAAFGTGTLTIDFGTYTAGTPGSFEVNADKTAKAITINNNQSSLNGIRDAINDADAGVTASIINDGSGYRLVIASNESGTKNSLRIQVSNDSSPNNTDRTGLSRLAFDPTLDSGSGKNMSVALVAKDAVFSIDGITITKPSNTVSDAIQGVTLNLLKTTGETPTTLTIARDTSGVKTAIDGFVKAYNDAAKTMQDLGGYDATTKTGGILQGDSTLRTMQSQLRSALTQQLGNSDAGLSTLSDIGIAFQRDGSISLDASKLNTVLADSSKNVGALFATMGLPSDSLISYSGSSSATQAGKYNIVLSQIATRATATGSAIASTTINNSNKTLHLSVDGTSVDVTLNTGSYTADTLAAELQARINSSAALIAVNKKVVVTQAAGKLTVAAGQYGSAYSVSISGGTGLASLFGTVSTTAGADVAGTVDGVAATGSGQMLTANGNAKGLKLLVSGGVTGARGTVSFSYGIAQRLDSLLDDMLGSDSTIAGRTAGITSSIKDIDNRREVLNRRLAEVEKRYRAQFNALDQMVASMQQTSNYLAQQLASLSTSNK